MDDLITWLRGVLDEDESAAQRSELVEEWDGETGEEETYWREDPRRAWLLADIAAKRAILDLHGGEHQCPTDLRPIGHAAEPVWYGLPVGGGMKWCPTVRLLATAYAHRPGYREEWRP